MGEEHSSGPFHRPHIELIVQRVNRCFEEVPDDSVQLQIINALVAAGLLSEDEVDKQRLLTEDGISNIKLHATLINSKFRQASVRYLNNSFALTSVPRVQESGQEGWWKAGAA